MSVFGKYADFYDFLYKDKNYKSECDAVEEIFKKYNKKKVSSILDLGCGTGNHAFIFADRGYKVVGIDRSEPMLSHAKLKLFRSKNRKNIRFEKADLRSWKTDEKFDAAVMMFAVLGYQLKNEDVLLALSTVKKHLKSDGLFIFDIWYGPAVVVQKPSERIKTVHTPNGKIKRFASSEIDTARQICTVHYTTAYIQNNHQIQRIRENHQMRYFFPAELDFFLQSSGLKLLKLGAFPEWQKTPDAKTWNIFGIAKAV